MNHFKIFLLNFAAIVCAQAMDSDELFTKIEKANLKGVQQILKDKPQLINAQHWMFGCTPLYKSLTSVITLKDNHQERVEILKEILQHKDLNINLGKFSVSPLIAMFYLNGKSVFEHNKRFSALMDIKPSLKLFFAHPKLDVTLDAGDRYGGTVLEVLENYNILGIDKYKNLLNFFLNLDEDNEKSWKFVLPKLVEMRDASVMRGIYAKLRMQKWFKEDQHYPLFALVFDVIANNALTCEGSEAISQVVSGMDPKVAYKDLSDDQKNKATIFMQGYNFAKATYRNSLVRGLRHYLYHIESGEISNFLEAPISDQKK